ncbi:MAG: FecR domain-containing protein [Prevotellaceae bacterium]|nr:FecR domain-containing protein [Prevotellaceae bacterium]
MAALLLGFTLTGYLLGGERRSPLAEVVVEAPLGSRTKLQLPDGSTVWLNAGSALRYPQRFGQGSRRVTLSGEGYFEVAHNAKLPFVVQAAELRVAVLGTKFNLRSYADDAEAAVSLIEGRVEVSSALSEADKVVLLPNRQALLHKESGRLRVADIQARHTSEWTKGYLFFDEELLPDIAKAIERSYNVHIRLAHDSLSTMRFYGSFVRGEQTIEQVMDLLVSTNKVAYRIEGKNIELKLRR